MIPQSQCAECREWFDTDVGFRKLTGALLKPNRPTHHARCRYCESKTQQSAVERRKKLDVFKRKARSTLSAHAKKFRMGERAFVLTYNWQSERVANLMRHAYEGACPYCHLPFAEMSGKEKEVTIDIRDPALPPYLETNVVMCCRNCNLVKQDLPPDTWARTLQFWRKAESAAAARAEPQQVDMFA